MQSYKRFNMRDGTEGDTKRSVVDEFEGFSFTMEEASVHGVGYQHCL